MYYAFSLETNELATALVQVQSEITDPKKNTSGYGYKYATLDQVLAIVRPAFTKNGLAFTQMTVTRDAKASLVEVVTRVMHTSGQWMESTLGIWADEAKGMSRAQSIGSIITYARRYSLQSIAGIAAEEDTDAAKPSVTTEAAEIEDFI